MADFSVVEYLREEGRVILTYPGFDFDKFADIAESLVMFLSAQVIEKQDDADLSSWLIRFEDTLFLLRSEFYSQSLWIEALSVEHSLEQLDCLVQQLESD